VIKNKEDARQFLMDAMGGFENTKWEGFFYTLNEVQTENTYRWNAAGARIFDEEKQIEFNKLINIAFKNRKGINNYYKSLKF